MTGFAWMCLAFALGYPVFKWYVNSWNDRAEQALRERGFDVPRKRRQVGQGVPRTKQPPRGTGMRGPIEGKVWGQFWPH